MRSPRARSLLHKMLRSEAPSIRGFGALGLGLLKDRRSIPQLGQVARSVEAGPTPRAAAAFALGELGAKSQVDALVQLSEAAATTVRATAIIALARLHAEAAPHAIADALVSIDPVLQQAAAGAALVLATGDYRTAPDTYAVPQGRVDPKVMLSQLQPRGYTAEEHALALVKLAPAVSRACIAAVQSSPQRSRVVADALLARDGAPAFGPLTERLGQAEQAARKQAEQAAETIAAAVVPPFVALSSHPSTEVRARAVQLLATRSESAARAAVIDALSDPSERVQRAALAALGSGGRPGASEAIAALLAPQNDWPVRVRAAEALGKLAAGSNGARATRALSAAALRDEYALVREAAVTALARVNPAAARPVLRRVMDNDAEPRVRLTAKSLLPGTQ
jgi:HEAT repeat protein